MNQPQPDKLYADVSPGPKSLTCAFDLGVFEFCADTANAIPQFIKTPPPASIA